MPEGDKVVINTDPLVCGIYACGGGKGEHCDLATIIKSVVRKSGEFPFTKEEYYNLIAKCLFTSLSCKHPYQLHDALSLKPAEFKVKQEEE